MATATVLVSDLDGAQPAATVPFSVEDHKWEIDLTEEQVVALYDVLETYIVNGRRLSGPGAVPSTVTKRRRSVPKIDLELQERIRVWARANQHRVADRGRLPRSVVEAYQAAHPDEAIPA